MTNISPFHFLRLPSVAQDEIQKCMTVVDLFKLSMTSIKTRCVVKSYTRCRSLEINFFLTEDFEVYIGNLKIKMEKQEKKVKTEFINTSRNILEQLMNYTAANGQFVSVWEGHHMKVALKYFIEYLAEVFNRPFISPLFQRQPNLFVFNIIRLIKKLNLKMNYVTVVSDSKSDELNDFVLNECRDSSELFINCETSDDFESEFTPHAPFRNDELRIAKAKWVTISHLNELFIDVKKLYLEECRFDHLQITTFLRRWIQGCRLEHVDLEYKGSLHSILDLLDVAEVPYSQSTFHIRTDFMVYEQQRVINICQKNGKNASLFVNEEKLILTTNWQKEEINEEDEEIDDDEDEEDDEDVDDEDDEDDEDVVDEDGEDVDDEANSDDEGLANR